MGPGGAALGAALLALPFLSPVSLGPVTTPASAAIALLGWRLARGGRAALPDRLLHVRLPEPVHRAMGRVLEAVLARAARFARARHARLVEGARGRRLCGGGIVLGALLLAVPVPLLPLTNTFPALAILCFALAWTHRDGLLAAWGGAALAVSAAVFAALGTGAAVLGTEAVRRLAPWA
ncbi:MAG: exopolysaccharide biosynthesis protein [Gemmatimonadota bacterium]